MSARIRDSGVVTLALASQPAKVREGFLGTADYHLMMETINDTMII